MPAPRQAKPAMAAAGRAAEERRAEADGGDRAAGGRRPRPEALGEAVADQAPGGHRDANAAKASAATPAEVPS